MTFLNCTKSQDSFAVLKHFFIFFLGEWRDFMEWPEVLQIFYIKIKKLFRKEDLLQKFLLQGKIIGV